MVKHTQTISQQLPAHYRATAHYCRDVLHILLESFPAIPKVT